MKRINTWMLAEAGITLAMAYVLNLIKVLPMPYGGSITAGSMVPLLLFAFRWGGARGLAVCSVYGILDLVLGGHYYHWFSILFDYPIAFGLIGLAGFFGKKTVGVAVGTFVGLTGRFLCHVLSGVVAFAAYAPEGQHPLVYSVLYNGAYMLPELVISFVLVLLVLRYAKIPEPKLAA